MFVAKTQKEKDTALLILHIATDRREIKQKMTNEKTDII